jgi:catechol-2,3-dioxygenase
VNAVGVGMSVVVYAKDMTKVAEFYRRTLGVSSIEEAGGFILLAGNGVEISVVRIPEKVAATIVIARPPEVRETTPLKFSFLVPHLETVRAAAIATGGGLEPLDSAWSWRGMLHLDGFDPEGNVVQFRCPA